MTRLLRAYSKNALCFKYVEKVEDEILTSQERYKRVRHCQFMKTRARICCFHLIFLIWSTCWWFTCQAKDIADNVGTKILSSTQTCTSLNYIIWMARRSLRQKWKRRNSPSGPKLLHCLSIQQSKIEALWVLKKNKNWSPLKS